MPPNNSNNEDELWNSGSARQIEALGKTEKVHLNADREFLLTIAEVLHPLLATQTGHRSPFTTGVYHP